MKNSRSLGLGLLFSLIALQAPSAFAVTTLKQVQVSNGSQVDLLFDGKVTKGQIKTEFFNDIIQLSLTDVSVYPAKISTVNSGKLSKIFAYQYAPKLVRCRLSVRGKAEDFKDRLDIRDGGKIITVRLDGAEEPEHAAAAKSDLVASHSAQAKHGDDSAPRIDEAEERALLERVLKSPPAAATQDAPGVSAASAGAAAAGAGAAATGASAEANGASGASGSAKDGPAWEAVQGASAQGARPAQSASKQAAAAAAAASVSASGSSEDLPITSTGHAGGKGVGAASASSSGFMIKAFGKMIAVLAFFGLLAFGFKKYILDQKADGKVLGAIGRFARQNLGRKSKMIEVVSSHYLGPKKSIAVVRVAGRMLVLGITNENINLITQLSGDLDAFDASDLGELEPAGGAVSAGPAVFSDLLSSESAKPASRAPVQNGPVGSPSRASSAAAIEAAPAAPGGIPGELAQSYGPSVRNQIKSRLEGLKPL